MNIEKIYNERFALKKRIYRAVLPVYLRGFIQKLRGKQFYKPYFDEYECIFIHIPKSAGQSVCDSLFGDRYPGHWKISDYEWENPRKCENYFKFCFVRNPYSRLVSAYNYLKEDTQSPIDRYFQQKVLVDYSNFEDFVKRGLMVPEVLSYIHFVPQVEFMKNMNGRVSMDFIGKVESLSDDYKYVSHKLGMSDSSLKFINSSKSVDIDTYYDEEMKKVVQNIYSEDFQLLGYDV